MNFILEDYYLSIGDSIVSSLASFDGKNFTLRDKIMFCLDNLPKDVVIATSIDSNAELLQKIYSVLNDQVDVDVLIAIFLLVFKFV